jgi:ABC-type multidrug transport system fused ATPase/permease subunit
MNDKRDGSKCNKREQKHQAAKTNIEINGTLAEQYSNLWFAYKYIYRANRRIYVSRTMLLIIQTTKTIIPIFFIRAIINEITIGRSVRKVFFYALFMAVSLFLVRVFEHFLAMWDAREKEFFHFGVQRILADSVGKMRYSTMEHPEMQNYIWWAQNNRFNDILTYTTGVASALFNIIGIGSLVMTLNWKIQLVIIISASFKFIIERYQRKLPQKYNDNRSRIKRLNLFYGNLIQNIRYGKEIRANNLERWLYNKYDENWRYKLLPLEKKYICVVSVLQFISGILSIFQEIIIYLLLAIEMLGGAMTIGDFSMYLSAANTFSNSIIGLSNNYSSLMLRSAEFLKEYRKCLQIVAEEALDDGDARVDYTKNVCVRFVNVSFKYPGTDIMILRNVNICINRGETLSIVGENGAGKTTFVKLLCRFYEPTSGEIYINDTLAKDIPLNEYYKMISVVFQDFKLFSFSLKENISMDTMIDDEHLNDSIRKVGLEERIKTLPNGVDTFINKEFDAEGIELSGGEGQKIAIARGVYRDTPIIVFDEPTSALDPIAEYNIYRNFHDLANNRTAIYISHRLASTRFTDHIAVFANNTIAEYGTHDELVRLDNGIYRKMFETQSHYYRN